ncbi:MAG TPA: peptidyl-prolyl cis-trans isomerase [Candidatus Eisenbacteria bacterium]|nr:peptidyl-prolyl cis-trans isomerase [Candidatus Eisenbacteria bacterium]
MIRAFRLRSAAFLLLAVSAGLAGCSGGPAPEAGAGATAKAAGAGKTAGRPGVWHPGKADTLGPVVAIYGNRRLTRHDVDSIIATAPPDIRPRLRTPDGYRQLIERLIFEDTVIRMAEREKIESDSTYKAEIEKAVRSAKMRVYYNRRLAALPPPSDSLVRATYDANIAQYHIPARIRVRHIQLATQREARDVRARLVKGALWDEVCKSRSQDAVSKDRGGLVGYLSKEADLVPGIGTAPAIVAGAFALKEDEISQPLKGPKGWHLIRVDNREEATVQPFEQVRARIVLDLEGKIQDEFSAAFTDSLKGLANGSIFDDSIAVALQPVRTPVDYFKEAQAAIQPQDRIDLYKGVIQKFPNDSVAVQARFMIGFTYAEELGDYEAAKAAFEDFLQHHPTHELATSARWMMENMDKPPPTMQDDNAPADSSDATPGAGGGTQPEKARRSP